MKHLTVTIPTLVFAFALCWQLYWMAGLTHLSPENYYHPDVALPTTPAGLTRFFDALLLPIAVLFLAHRFFSTPASILWAGAVFLLSPSLPPVLGAEDGSVFYILVAIISCVALSGRAERNYTLPLLGLMTFAIAMEEIALAFAAAVIPLILARCKQTKPKEALLETAVMLATALVCMGLLPPEEASPLIIDAPYWMLVVTAPEMMFRNLAGWFSANPDHLYLTLWNPLSGLTVSLIYWVGLIIMYRICARLAKFSILPLFALLWVVALGILPLLTGLSTKAPVSDFMAVLLSLPLILIVIRLGEIALTQGSTAHVKNILTASLAGLAFVGLAGWLTFQSLVTTPLRTEYEERISRARAVQGDTLPLLVEEGRIALLSGRKDEANNLLATLTMPDIYPDATIPYTEREFVISWFLQREGDQRNSRRHLQALQEKRPHDPRITELLLATEVFRLGPTVPQ